MELAIRTDVPTNQTYLLVDEGGGGHAFQMCVTVMTGTVAGYFSAATDNTTPMLSNVLLRLSIIEPGYACIFDYNTQAGEIFWGLTNPSLVYGSQISVMVLQQSNDNDTNSVVQLADGFPQAALLSGRKTEVRNQQDITFPPNQLIYFNFLLATATTLNVDLYAISGGTRTCI